MANERRGMVVQKQENDMAECMAKKFGVGSSTPLSSDGTTGVLPRLVSMMPWLNSWTRQEKL